MKIEIEKLPKKTIKLKITITKEKLAEAREHVVDEMVREAEIEGFRKGQAPRSLVEPKLDKGKIRGEVINHLVPQAYDQAIKESLLKPMILPKIEVETFEEDKDFIFTAITCEAPVVSLGDYKSQISNLKSQNKDDKIILGLDGQPVRSSRPSESQDPQEEKINKIFDAILKSCDVEIPDLLIEDEVGRMLSRLIDQTGRLGLTVDQYLESVGKTVETLKKEYGGLAEKSLKLEFLLQALSKAEEIKLEEKEISDTINSAPDEASKKNLSLPENRAYLQSVLVKNKLIQKLLSI